MTASSEQAATGSQPASGTTAAEAIEALYQEHGLGMVRLAVMFVGDQPTAEDVVQEAFLGLYRGWHRVRDQGTVVAYLRTAVINGARSALRSRGRRDALLIKAAEHDPPVWSAEAAAIDGEDRRALMTAVAGLTQRQREVLKVLSRTQPPSGSAWQGLAAIDGGTKFLVETAGDPCSGDKPIKIYLLTPGRPVGLRPVITLPGLIDEFTASADGGTLAYLAEQCKAGRPTSPVVGVVRNGATRDWTVPSSVNPGSLSLSADGGELGYVNFALQGQRGAASVLSTSSPPGSLARWSRPVFVPTRRGQQGVALVLNADGQTMYLITAPANQLVAMTETLSAYDVATGTRLRTLHAWSGVRGLPVIVADGTHALIQGMHFSSVDEVNLATGSAATFRQLPYPDGGVMAVAW
jgi:RNA polymerase sigma factor (sigma-70 family)